MFRGRVKAVRSKAVPFKYYRAMSGGDLPDYAAIPARHFTNLFELPVLFYAACLASMILQVNGPVMVGLAWTFVVFKIRPSFRAFDVQQYLPPYARLLRGIFSCRGDVDIAGVVDHLTMHFGR